MIQNNYLLNKKVFKNFKNEILELENKLEKNNLLILSGLKYIGKLDIVISFLRKNKLEDSFIYFNKKLDQENKINTGNDIIEYIKNNKKTKYIILQNISNIKNIKECISFLYNSKFKTIIIGNNIKISSIPEIQVKTKFDKYSLEYGNLGKISLIGDIDFKKEYLDLIRKNLINEEIIFNKSIKNNNSYNYTLSFLSKNRYSKSIRELHRDIEKIDKISLKTFMDYISFSKQAKLLEQVYTYDCKKNDVISSKSNFYFTDNGIRNSISNYSLNKNILIENTIFIKLNLYNYNIFNGKNGSFDFSFIGEKDNKKIYIHISKEKDKSEIKKEVKKLLKIGDDFQKYLIINDLEKIGFKKTKFESVKIISFNEIIKKDLS